MSFEIINPASLGAPRGWNNGMLAPADGRVLFVAGQVGLEPDESGQPPEFADQFTGALDKVLTVVRAAGGGPEDVGRMTVYVTDLVVYRATLGTLGEAWRARFGKHFPAMALVEIEATAVIGGNRL